jgi:hypothetical protein
LKKIKGPSQWGWLAQTSWTKEDVDAGTETKKSLLFFFLPFFAFWVLHVPVF